MSDLEQGVYFHDVDQILFIFDDNHYQYQQEFVDEEYRRMIEEAQAQ